MKIGILVGHPTQFEGPLFRYASTDVDNELRVIYTEPERLETVFDSEVSTNISWGIDLLSGYQSKVLPRKRRLRWLFAELERERYDLLIINGYNRREYVSAALVGRLKRTPLALRLDSVPYNNSTLRKRLLKKIMFALLSKLYRHFFAIGHLTVNYLQYIGIRRERISIFSYVVDNDFFAQGSTMTSAARDKLMAEYHVPHDRRVIISVAKFNYREAPWDLLRAFCDLPPLEYCLLLIGDGEQRSELEKYALTHPDHRIIFAGYVPYPKLPSLYGVADLFVHPALDEPWGVSVQEALACGLPVIASSRVGAGYDLIVEGRNGFVYCAGDCRDLHRKIVRLFEEVPRDMARSETSRLLQHWNYATAWRTVIDVAERCRNELGASSGQPSAQEAER